MVYHIGVCATICNIPGLFTENRSFIGKLEENETEGQSIVTVPVLGVAQQYSLFSMLLPMFGLSHSVRFQLFRIFSVQNCLEYNGFFSTIETENTKLPNCDLSPCANDMEWDKPTHARAC